jgi:leucyl/phenylalanyl-tRNA--protein transferase
MRGKDLTVEMLIQGYRRGWFPMCVDEPYDEVEWFLPYDRCLFPTQGIHVSRSLSKVLRSPDMTVSFDQAFGEVILNCRRPTENWISTEIIRVYTQAHRARLAHSVEVWQDRELIGGAYGLCIGSAFFAESMFHKKTNASKVALYNLVAECNKRGCELFDAQVLNPHLESLGAFSVPNEEYQKFLAKAVNKDSFW